MPNPKCFCVKCVCVQIDGEKEEKKVTKRTKLFIKLESIALVVHSYQNLLFSGIFLHPN